jgi:hypothetical protein
MANSGEEFALASRSLDPLLQVVLTDDEGERPWPIVEKSSQLTLATARC